MNGDFVLVEAQLELLRECMYGLADGARWTHFVEGKEALLPTLRSLSAREASSFGAEHGPTIASHAWHIRYMLQGANAHCGDGPKPEGDWESSWSRADVTESEWTALVEEIEARYRCLVAWIKAQPSWEDVDIATGVLSLLPHLAFHLGAIRQLMRLKK